MASSGSKVARARASAVEYVQRGRQVKQLARQARDAAENGDFSAAISMLKRLESQQRGGPGGLVDGARRARAHREVSQLIAEHGQQLAAVGSQEVTKVWTKLKRLDRARGKEGLVNHGLRRGHHSRIKQLERTLLGQAGRMSRKGQHSAASKDLALARAMHEHRGAKRLGPKFLLTRFNARRRLVSALDKARSLHEARLNIRLMTAYAKEDGQPISDRHRARMTSGYLNALVIDKLATEPPGLDGQRAGSLAASMIQVAAKDGMLSPQTVRGILERVRGWTARGQQIVLSGDAAQVFGRLAEISPELGSLTQKRLLRRPLVALNNSPQRPTEGSRTPPPGGSQTPAPKTPAPAAQANDLGFVVAAPPGRKALTVAAPPTHKALPAPPTHKALPAPPAHKALPAPPTHKALPAPPTHEALPAPPARQTLPARQDIGSPALTTDPTGGPVLEQG